MDEYNILYKSKQILRPLFYDMEEANQYAKKLVYSPEIKLVKNVKNDLPKSALLLSNGPFLPHEIRDSIYENAHFTVKYLPFKLDGRTIYIEFIVSNKVKDFSLEKYNMRAFYMMMWLYIANLYSSKKSTQPLFIYVYFTEYEKKLPASEIHPIGPVHVNTGVTSVGGKEIVIFRKEEWFKVFLHETFHNLGLDFAQMNTTKSKQSILETFPIQSDIMLFETYSEVWADIWNILFCAYNVMQTEAKDKLSSAKRWERVYQYVETCLVFEREFVLYQCAKVLKHMGLNFANLHGTDEISRIARDQLYREKTNVFAYYIARALCMYDLNGFLLWCKQNNLSVVAFNQTERNQLEFAKYVKGLAGSANFTDMVDCFQRILRKQKKGSKLAKTLRMTLCDFL